MVCEKKHSFLVDFFSVSFWVCLRTVSDRPCTDAPSLTVRVTGQSASGLWPQASNPTCQRASNGAMGRVLTLPPSRFGLLARAQVACGPRASNPTCERGSSGVMGRVLTLPPLRFGLLARAQVACGRRLVTRRVNERAMERWAVY